MCYGLGMPNPQPKVITRQEISPGVYRYEIDGAEYMKASKVLYTHATVYYVNDWKAGDCYPLTTHKNRQTMLKAPQNKCGWVKVGVIEITPI